MVPQNTVKQLCKQKLILKSSCQEKLVLTVFVFTSVQVISQLVSGDPAMRLKIMAKEPDKLVLPLFTLAEISFKTTVMNICK